MTESTRKAHKPLLEFVVLQRLKATGMGKYFVSAEVVPLDGNPNWRIGLVTTSANQAACMDIVRLIERDMQREFVLSA